MQAVGNYINVLIDKDKQRERVISKSGIIERAPDHEYMEFYLQYGEILSVGDNVTNEEIKVGRKAIFHHTIEDEDRYFIKNHLDTRNEIRWVPTVVTSQHHKMFGVIDENGTIIPLPEFIFCKPEEKEIEPEHHEEILEFAGQKVFLHTKAHAMDNGQTIYTAFNPAVEKPKNYVTIEVLHTSPSESLIAPGDKIMAMAEMKYPITLLDLNYWVIFRERIIVKL